MSEKRADKASPGAADPEFSEEREFNDEDYSKELKELESKGGRRRKKAKGAVSFREAARTEEEEQITAFLRQTSMVRCERYNANLTVIGCARKKEAPPPRARTAGVSDEEYKQSHPCHGCVGPVHVNWPLDTNPIPGSLDDSPTPVIVKESDGSIFTGRAVAGWQDVTRPGTSDVPSIIMEGASNRSEDYTPPSPPAPGGGRGKHRPVQPRKGPVGGAARDGRSAGPPAAERSPSPGETAPVPPTEGRAGRPAPARKSKGKAAAQAKEKDVTRSAAAKEAATATPPAAEKSATSGRKRKAAGKEPGPCTLCGRPHTPKNWRGEICNPCYARRLRERKRNEASGSARPARPKREHLPCTICGRPYADRNWRGEICNPCYARKLRAKRKAAKAEAAAEGKKARKAKAPAKKAEPRAASKKAASKKAPPSKAPPKKVEPKKAATKKPAAEKPSPKKVVPKKAATKKPAAKKAAPKKATVKQTASKKDASKKTTAKKIGTKKAEPKKAATKEPAAKKAAPKKAEPKKAATKKAAAKKAATKKATAKKDGSRKAAAKKTSSKPSSKKGKDRKAASGGRKR